MTLVREKRVNDADTGKKGAKDILHGNAAETSEITLTEQYSSWRSLVKSGQDERLCENILSLFCKMEEADLVWHVSCQMLAALIFPPKRWSRGWKVRFSDRRPLSSEVPATCLGVGSLRWAEQSHLSERNQDVNKGATADSPTDIWYGGEVKDAWAVKEVPSLFP